MVASLLRLSQHCATADSGTGRAYQSPPCRLLHPSYQTRSHLEASRPDSSMGFVCGLEEEPGTIVGVFDPGSAASVSRAMPVEESCNSDGAHKQPVDFDQVHGNFPATAEVHEPVRNELSNTLQASALELSSGRPAQPPIEEGVAVGLAPQSSPHASVAQDIQDPAQIEAARQPHGPHAHACVQEEQSWSPQEAAVRTRMGLLGIPLPIPARDRPISLGAIKELPPQFSSATYDEDDMGSNMEANGEPLPDPATHGLKVGPDLVPSPWGLGRVCRGRVGACRESSTAALVSELRVRRDPDP